MSSNRPQNFCGKCGKPLKPGAKFCAHCGAKVKNADSDAAEAKPATTRVAAPVAAAPATAAAPAEPADAGGQEQEQKKKLWPLVLMGVGGAMLIVAIGLFVTNLTAPPPIESVPETETTQEAPKEEDKDEAGGEAAGIVLFMR